VREAGHADIPGLANRFQIGELAPADTMLPLALGPIPVSVIELAKLARRLGNSERKNPAASSRARFRKLRA
jgi:hypothetical protein